MYVHTVTVLFDTINKLVDLHEAVNSISEDINLCVGRCSLDAKDFMCLCSVDVRNVQQLNIVLSDKSKVQEINNILLPFIPETYREENMYEQS